MTAELGVGVIGVGQMGAWHVDAWERIDTARVVAVADPRETASSIGVSLRAK